jgi:hypothetical protein
VEPRIMDGEGQSFGVSMKERFCDNRLHGCGHMSLAFTYKICKK